MKQASTLETKPHCEKKAGFIGETVYLQKGNLVERKGNYKLVKSNTKKAIKAPIKAPAVKKKIVKVVKKATKTKSKK
jgi:hypothetical protein